MTDIFTRLITDEVIKIAKRMLKMGLSLDDIADATELDIDTIKDLQEHISAKSDNADTD